MAQILPAPARSLKEFRLLPGYTSADGSVHDVLLETKLCRTSKEERPCSFEPRYPAWSADPKSVPPLREELSSVDFEKV